MPVIDVFIDFSCPWSYIAHHRLAVARHPNTQWRARAFQLNPDISADGLDRTTYRVDKFGSLFESQRRDGVVVEAGRKAGLDIDFGAIETTPNTRNAHRAMKAVEHRGEDSVALAEAIFDAYFTRGRDIGDVDVLLDLANSIGVELDRSDLDEATVVDDRVRTDIAAAHRAGLSGVPFFVTDTDTDPHPISGGAAIAALTGATS